MLPLLAGYIAIIGGAGASPLRASLLFLAGFVVFIALGATASTRGGLLASNVSRGTLSFQS